MASKRFLAGPVLLYSTLGIGLLVFAGCSSSLDEYRCTTNSQCIDDEGQGICHSSGYCAFVDFDECDGYRFGKLSGEQSGLCVSAEEEIDAGAGQVDAGPDAAVDIDPTAPVAAIAPFTLDCGQTDFVPDGRGSEAFDGADLVTFSWTLRSPGGAPISTLSGPPDAAFSPNTNFLTGDVDNPLLNITPYRGKHAAFVDTDETESVVFYENIASPPGPHRLSFAVASETDENTAQGFQFLIGIEPETIIVDDTVVLTETLTTHTLEINPPFGLPDAAVVFVTTAGEFYLDNVRLHSTASDASSDTQLISNSSFEVNLLGWDEDHSNPTAFSEIRDLPSYLGQYGTYEVELVVTDSEGLSSQPATLSLTHAPCP